MRSPCICILSTTALVFVKDLDGRIFPFAGDITRFPHVNKYVMSATSELLVVEFRQLGRQREAGPAALQFDMLRISPVLSSTVGSSSSDTANSVVWCGMV